MIISVLVLPGEGDTTGIEVSFFHLHEQLSPKTGHRRKFRREIKAILEEECSDDAG